MVVKIIIAVLIFLLFAPLRINYIFYINLLQNRGAMAICIFFKNVIQYKFKISGGQVTTTNQRNKAKTFDLSLDDKSVIFLNAFTQSLIKTITLDDTYIGFEIGKKDDAMATSIISGTALMFTDLIFAQVFTRKSGSTHSIDIEPLFSSNKLTLCMQNILYVTIFDTLFSALRGYLIMKKKIKCKVKDNKQESNQKTEIKP